MNSISFLNTVKKKLVFISIVPILVLSLSFLKIEYESATRIGEENIEILAKQVRQAREIGVKNMIDSLYSMIISIKDNPEYTQDEAKMLISDLLLSISYGKDNYVFGYDKDLNNILVHGDASKDGGSPSQEVMDLLRNLYETGRGGGGFYEFKWTNPATDTTEREPKVAYTAVIPGWDWMIGTGVYLTDVEAMVATARQELSREISDTLKFGILFSLLGAIVAISLGFFVTRSITGPLNSITSLMSEMAAGDGDLTKRLPENDRGEFGRLSKEFNSFITKIQEIVAQLLKSSSELKRTSEEVNSVVYATSGALSAQREEADQIASSINEMSVTTHQVAGNTNTVKEGVDKMNSFSADGMNAMRSASSSTQEMVDSLHGSSDRVKALAKKTDDIHEVLEVIHSVTDQTNLLALNAAIEAARAGDHGRGFSVVADEVRQLAQRSSESADRIKGMLESFAEDASDSVAKMEYSTKQVQLTLERINSAEKALQSIATASDGVHSEVTQIATATEEQSQVSEEINSNISRIVDATSTSEIEIKNAQEASRELESISSTLNGLVKQFKI